MKCEELLHYLSEYIDQELDVNLRLEAEEHLASCQNCQVVLDTTRRTILLYRQDRTEELPPAINQALYSRLEAVFNQGIDSLKSGGMET